MTHHIAAHPLGAEARPTPLRLLQRPPPRPAVQPCRAAQPGWPARLAAWAERQPAHHHMGSWERLR